MKSPDEDKRKRWTATGWNGSRSVEFDTIFTRDVRAGALGTFLKDDRHSFWSAYEDTDQGGGALNAPALPPVGLWKHITLL